jgi:hypothetical protein
VKVAPLPLPTSSQHGISAFQQDSIQSNITTVRPISAVPALDPTQISTSVGFSNIEEPVANLVFQPEEEAKVDHF